MSTRPKLPRKVSDRPPSARDRFIHEEVRINCRRQCDVAKEIGVDKSRISQIVKRVENWLGGTCASQRRELEPVDRQRVERQIELARQDHLYTKFVRQCYQFEQPGVTARKREKGGVVEFVERTTRDRGNLQVQALKSALRASEARAKLLSLDPLPEPQPARTERFLAQATWEYLSSKREEAEKAGLVKKSGFQLWNLIHDWMHALFGEKMGLQAPEERAPGTVFWETAERMLEKPLAAVGPVCRTGPELQMDDSLAGQGPPRQGGPTLGGPTDEPSAQLLNSQVSGGYSVYSTTTRDGSAYLKATYNPADQLDPLAYPPKEAREKIRQAIEREDAEIAKARAESERILAERHGGRTLQGYDYPYSYDDYYTQPPIHLASDQPPRKPSDYDDPIGRAYAQMERELKRRRAERRRLGLPEDPPSKEEIEDSRERARQHMEGLVQKVVGGEEG